jgi:hypothetical protein
MIISEEVVAMDYKAISGRRNEEKKALYKTLIDNLIKSKDRPQLTAVVEHCMLLGALTHLNQPFISPTNLLVVV